MGRTDADEVSFAEVYDLIEIETVGVLLLNFLGYVMRKGESCLQFPL